MQPLVLLALRHFNSLVLSWRMMWFWYSASVAAHAMLKRMSQNDEATIVFHECFRASCRDMRNLSASLARL